MPDPTPPTPAPTPPEKRTVGTTFSKVVKFIANGAVAGLVIALAPFIWAFFTPEQWLLFVSLAIAVVASILLIAIFKYPQFFVRLTSIPGPDGKPVEASAIPPYSVRIILIVIVIAIAFFILWYRWGDFFVPMATITTFEKSNIRHLYGQQHNSFIVPINEYIFIGDKNEEMAERASRFAKLTIVRNREFRTKSVHIESVEFSVDYVPILGWRRKLSAYPFNMILPARYNVNLTHESTAAKAQMLDDNGDPTEGVIVLKANDNSADMHFSFLGESGLYYIRPIITVTDEWRQNRRKIGYEKELSVVVHNEDLLPLLR